MAGSDLFVNRSKLMNLPVMPGHFFHPDSQEMLDRPWTFHYIEGDCSRACGNSPAFRQGLKHLKGRNGLPDMTWCGGLAGVQEHSFHVNSQIPTSLPRRVVHGNSWVPTVVSPPFSEVQMTIVKDTLFRASMGGGSSKCVGKIRAISEVPFSAQ